MVCSFLPADVGGNARQALPAVLPSSVLVLDPLAHAAYLRHQIVQIRLVLHEIDVGRVDDEKRCLLVMVEEVIICLIQVLDILVRDLRLVVPVALADPLHEHSCGGLQVDDQIRPWHVLAQDGVETLVEHQFRVVQVQIGEDLVLREDVVAQGDLVEQVRLGELPLLPVPVQEEEELGLERGSRLLLVEIAEEGILDVFHDLDGVEPGREQIHEARLADADRPFHGYELSLHGASCYHATPRFRSRHWTDPGSVRASLEKRGDVDAEDRMCETARDLGQRLENETPRVEPWMRHLEAGSVDEGVTHQEDVQIDRPRPLL
jgi:hypothetical protein